MTQHHVEESQDAERLAAASRLRAAADQKVADKAAADADAIAKADEIVAKDLAAGEIGQPSGAVRRQPKRNRKTE